MRKLTLEDMSLCPFLGGERNNNRMLSVWKDLSGFQSSPGKLNLSEVHRPRCSEAEEAEGSVPFLHGLGEYGTLS